MTGPGFSTTAALGADLARLGLRAGDGVFVHASLRAVGPVVGGARAMVSALIGAVGEAGLIAMPGFSQDAYMPEGIEGEGVADAVLGYDAALSPAAGMGAVAEAFRTWPGTRRSAHPTSSVCARGPDAAQLLAPHPLAWSTGPDTPWGALQNRPAMKILLIGVGWNRCSALHTAETMAPNRRTKTRRFKHGGAWVEAPDVADDLDTLFPPCGAAFEATGAVALGRIGGAQARLCGYGALTAFAAPWLTAAIARGEG